MPILKKEFDLNTYIQSAKAKKLGYTEQFNPPPEIIMNIRKFHDNIVVPLLDMIPVGAILRITNCYRCKRTNEAVDGKDNSDHLQGSAGDIELWLGEKECNGQLFSIIKTSKLKWRQLIREKGSPDNPAWCHISWVEGDLKMQVLRA